MASNSYSDGKKHQNRCNVNITDKFSSITIKIFCKINATPDDDLTDTFLCDQFPLYRLHIHIHNTYSGCTLRNKTFRARHKKSYYIFLTIRESWIFKISQHYGIHCRFPWNNGCEISSLNLKFYFYLII